MNRESALPLPESGTRVHPRASAANEFLCDLGVLGGEKTGPERESGPPPDALFAALAAHLASNAGESLY